MTDRPTAPGDSGSGQRSAASPACAAWPGRLGAAPPGRGRLPLGPDPAARARPRRAEAPAAPVPAWPDRRHPAGDRRRRCRCLLRQAAAWAWRLILVAVLIYGTFRVAVTLRLVVLPFIAALLLTALLQPLAARLRRFGLADLAATWCTFLLAIVDHRGRGDADRQPGQRRLPDAGGRGPAHGQRGPAVPGRAAVPPARRPAAAAHQPGGPVHLPAQVGDRRHRRHRREDLPGDPDRPGADAVHLVLPAQGRRPDLALADQRAGPGAAPADVARPATRPGTP